MSNIEEGFEALTTLRPRRHTKRGRIGSLHLVEGPVRHLEPTRDWSFGFGIITGHRTTIAVTMTTITWALYWYQDKLWPHPAKAHTSIQQVIAILAILWLGAVIPGFMGMLGQLAFKFPTDLDDIEPIKQTVYWRICTLGTNRSAATSTILRCELEMAETPLFDHRIEVIIERTEELSLYPPETDKLSYIIVPPSLHYDGTGGGTSRITETSGYYDTPKFSRYKARALQYALENSPAPDDAWLVHLDEETQPTSSGVKGIAKFIRAEEEAGTLRVGQGAILYHRNWEKHPIMTLADNVRTGDDFARFYFQHKLGRTVFGLHGSFIVVRNDVEKSAGFDFGPQGSITEDAFWALVLMQNGTRAAWVDGYLEEQSTEGLLDFLKQRQRWYQGLVKVSLHAPVKLRWRFALGMNTALWTLAPFAVLYTLIHFWVGTGVDPLIRAGANLSFASFVTLYLTGLRANLREHRIRKYMYPFWFFMQLILTPIFSVWEATGVFLAIFRPVKGFYVVHK